MKEREPISPSLRWKVFARDDFSCVYCGRGPTESAMHIDHVKAVARGGKSNEENLVTACVDCNYGKGVGLPPDRKAKKLVDDRMDIALQAREESLQVIQRAHAFAYAQMKEMEDRGIPEQSAALAVLTAWIRLSAMVWQNSDLPLKKKQHFLKLCASMFDEIKP